MRSLYGRFLLLAAGAAACGRGGAPGKGARAAPVVTAETAVAEVKPFPVLLDVLGGVAARPGGVAEIAAPGPSCVVRLYVAPGDVVRPGPALVELDRTVWLAELRRAEAARAAAQQAFDRARRLAAEGILPRKEAEKAAADLASATTALIDARHRLELSVLRTPIGGKVVRLDATLGAPVDAGRTLVEVVDPAALEIAFRVSPADAAAIAPGAPVRITFRQEPGRGIRGDARIVAVGQAVDSTTGGVEVRAALSRPTPTLRVGENLAGRIQLGVHPRAVVVPVDALVPTGTGTYQVFVVDAQGIAHATPVTVGGRTESEVEILSGLRGGETVVARGAYAVVDGARIRSGRG